MFTKLYPSIYADKNSMHSDLGINRPHFINHPLFQMTKYINADFADDDSVNSVHLNEGISTSATHIRYQPSTSIWRMKSPLEKVLLLLVAILLFVIFVLAVIIYVTEHRLHERVSNYIFLVDGVEKVEPCLNKTCVHIASNILESMDTSVDPCDDFYSYSCNGWAEANPIPDGKGTWGVFLKLEQQNQQIIKHVLEKPMETLKSKAEQKAKMYYESCLDVNDTVEDLGAKPMLDLLRKLGGWNITDSGFNVDTWTLQNITQTVQNKYNIGALFSYAVGEDDKNSSRHILQIDQSGLGLPTRDIYFNKTEEHGKILKAYLEYMTKVGNLLRVDNSSESTESQMKAVIEFETRLANITIPSDLRRDEESLYNLMTIAELQETAPFLNWRDFFEDAMRIVGKKITVKEQIVVYAPDYLSNLTELITEYNSTTEGKIVLNDYMVWQTVRLFTVCLSKAFRDAYKGLRTAIMGTESGEEPQWRYCIQDTNNVLGYPEFIKDPNQLDKRFESLLVRNDTYFENNVNINTFNWKKNMEKINEAVNKSSWSKWCSPPASSRAPSTTPPSPPSLNYGGMGVVMGHELTHGFDDQGRQFDKYGNLNHWWKKKTIDKFKQRTKCIVDQYNKYKINGTNIKGNQTLGENIADNSGLKAAYHAYLELMDGKPEPQPLPGIPLNHRQLFFVAFAQVWCSTVTKQAVALQIDKDSHSPVQYRVIGALSNLKEFSQEFNCKLGSKMNPKTKCEVW
ncbi:hypothetical protein NQ317_013539 [Molorchus minor]|uniref:Endothelin-converting enzyme 1 n=1 Tax=Molorchus minor TaxID=1323400 RepID=A0ABQ9JY17_9CUCU|nr:hypothetical protein NQ317_013539 [Molorchus minor]